MYTAPVCILNWCMYTTPVCLLLWQIFITSFIQKFCFPKQKSHSNIPPPHPSTPTTRTTENNRQLEISKLTLSMLLNMELQNCKPKTNETEKGGKKKERKNMTTHPPKKQQHTHKTHGYEWQKVLQANARTSYSL